MNKEELINGYTNYVMPTYTRQPVVFVRGKGTKIWDIGGREYLDFFPGWAVSGLGHSHPLIQTALRAQLKKIFHVPNNYYNEWQGLLAQKIAQNAFDGKVFFCNSGAESVEAAIKLSRKYGSEKGRYEIITMENSFHGRTLAALTATGQEKYQQGFAPLPPGFTHVPFNNFTAVKEKVTAKTAAIMLELIQGEGGINVADGEYVRALRKLCDETGILLIFDEVQTGIGRTGRMFCFQHYGVEPDILTLAKSLGGGFPIGATLARRKIADVLGPGTHASTFGGSPLASAAGIAVFQAIETENLLHNVETMGKYLYEKLAGLQEKYPALIKEIRGKGLMLGIELTREGKSIYEKCLSSGLLINCTHEKVLRIMPQLAVRKSEIGRAMKILSAVIAEINPQ